MKNNKFKKLTLIIIPLILIMIGICCFFIYQTREIDRVKAQTYSILRDAENEQIQTLKSKVNGSFSIITAFSNMLVEQNIDDRDILIKQMKAVIHSSDYQHILIVDRDGNAFSEDKNRINIAERDYFKKALLGEKIIERVEKDKMSGAVKIVTAVPLVKDGEILGIVCAAYDENIFRKLLSSHVYSGEGYSFITKKDGQIIIGSDNTAYTLKDRNLLTVLQTAEFDDGSTFDVLKNDMQLLQSGITLFTLDGGKKRYATYQSAGFQDWIMFNVLPGEVVEEALDNSVKNYYVLFGILIVIFVTIIVFLVVMARKQLQYIEMEEDYRKQLLLYRTSKSGGVFSAIIDDGFTLLYGNDKYYEIHEYTQKEIQEELKNKCINYIFPDDVPKARAILQQAIRAGDSYIDFIMRTITRTGKLKYIWVGAIITNKQSQFLLNGTVIDVTVQKQTEIALNKERQSLKISEERFRIALETTNLSIWEYDFTTRRITQSIKSQSIHGFERVIDDVPDSLINSGYIHPDSVGDVKILYDKLLSGEKKVEGIFKIIKPINHEILYERIRYTVIFDSDNKPFKAIGVSDDVTDQMNILQKYQMEASIRQNLNKNIYTTAVINLLTDEIESIESIDVGQQALIRKLTLEDIVDDIADRITNDQNVKYQIRSISPKLLLDFYESGTNTLQFQYLQSMGNDTLKWFLLKIHIAQNPVKNCVYAFFYLQDIDEEKRRQEELEIKANTDFLTGIYNLNFAKQEINNYINAADKEVMSAFFMIDLDNFKQVNDNMGHSVGDSVLINMANILKENLMDHDIIGRIGGDEFIVFMKNISSAKLAINRANKLVKDLQYTIIQNEKMIKVTASIGITICKGNKKNYDMLYRKADEALYKAKGKGKNQVILIE